MPEYNYENGLRTRKLALLAHAIERHVPKTGDHTTVLPTLSLHRRDAPTEPVHCIYGLGLAVTTQGRKRVMLRDKVIDYGAGQCMLTPIDLPVVAHITRATEREPYLGLMLKLDIALIVLMASEMKLSQADPSNDLAEISIERVEPEVLDALGRLIGLLDDPQLLSHLAPLIQREIVVRLLAGPHGLYLRQLSAEKPPRQQVAKVVAWMKQNFSEAVSVDDLAARANMSVSTFRQHFRTVMGMSPLRFQKQLRLQEARQLMLNQNIDANSAAIHVGYESASQFSREYRRQFGAPPQANVRRIRSA